MFAYDCDIILYVEKKVIFGYFVCKSIYYIFLKIILKANCFLYLKKIIFLCLATKESFTKDMVIKTF